MIRIAAAWGLPALTALTLLAGCKAADGEACRCGNDCQSDRCAGKSSTKMGGDCFSYTEQTGVCDKTTEKDGPSDLPEIPVTPMPVLDLGADNGTTDTGGTDTGGTDTGGTDTGGTDTGTTGP